MNRLQVLFTTAALCSALLLSGCGAALPADGRESADGAVKTGQITKLSDSQITINLADVSSGGSHPSSGENQTAPSERPSGDLNRQAPAAPSGQPSDNPNGQPPASSGNPNKPDGSGAMQFTGETTTCTIGENTKVVRLVRNGNSQTEETISADDLQLGDVISVEMDGQAAVRITLISHTQGGETSAPVSGADAGAKA